MSRLTRAFRWLRALIGRVSDDEIDEELRFHLAMEADLLERDGMSRDLAVASAASPNTLKSSAMCGEAESWRTCCRTCATHSD
jgi:hypothetical protein